MKNKSLLAKYTYLGCSEKTERVAFEKSHNRPKKTTFACCEEVDGMASGQFDYHEAIERST